MKLSKTLFALSLAVILPACSMIALGPDLSKAPSPFGDAATIRLVGDDGNTTEIHHTADGDTTTLKFDAVDQEKTFDGSLTWEPVTSADAGDSTHDYWLAGINIFKTADRSAYIVLRYPHGLKIARPMTSDAFESILITCQMRGVDPTSLFDSGEASSSSSAAPQKPCDFAARADLDAFLPQMMAEARKAETAGTASDSSGDDYHWQKMTVVLP